MSVNSISNQYVQLLNSQGNGDTKFECENDTLVFTDANGETYTAELDNDDKEYNDLYNSSESKQKDIKSLSDSIKEIYEETLKEQEEVTKNEYQRILNVMETCTAQFYQDRADGKNVQASDLQAAVSSEIANSDYDAQIANVFENLSGVDSKMQQMSLLLGELDDIGSQMKVIEQNKQSSFLDQIEELSGFDSSENFFTGTIGDSDASAEALNYTFTLDNFKEVYTEKLEGHKSQYTLISNFKGLDDSIIEMYKEYAGNIGAMQQEVEVEQQEQQQEENEEDEQVAA